jgi:uncharacterized protein YbjT (DUF2867 family)
VTRDDIADVVVAVLTGEGHDGKTVNVTGREALSLGDVAALLTEITGRQCTFYDETIDEAKASRAVYNASDEMVETWISSYTSIANGEMALVSDAVEKLTGHPPQTVRDYILQHPECYQHLIVEGEMD